MLSRIVADTIEEKYRKSREDEKKRLDQSRNWSTYKDLEHLEWNDYSNKLQRKSNSCTRIVHANLTMVQIKNLLRQALTESQNQRVDWSSLNSLINTVIQNLQENENTEEVSVAINRLRSAFNIREKHQFQLAINDALFYLGRAR